MASNNVYALKKRKYFFPEEAIQAMHDAGCKNAADGMRDGRAPSGRDINKLAPTMAAKVNKIIRSGGVGAEDREPAGV